MSVDQFAYLSVLISIIIGLGITHLLTGVGRFLGGSDVPRVFGVHVVWTVNILLYQAFFWWFTFKWADLETWTFGLFLFVLAYAILLYLLAVILYPVGLPAGFDFRGHFYRRRRWFFSVLAFLSLVDVVDTVLKGPENISGVGRAGLIFLASSMSGPVVAAFARRPLFHKIYSVYWGVALISWILYSQGVLRG